MRVGQLRHHPHVHGHGFGGLGGGPAEAGEHCDVSSLSVAALVACVGLAVFVFLSVPWAMTGMFNRSGNGLPMQIAMLPCLVVLLASGDREES